MNGFSTALDFVTAPGWQAPPGMIVLSGLALAIIGMLLIMVALSGTEAKARMAMVSMSAVVLGIVAMMGGVGYGSAYYAESCDTVIAGISDGLLREPTPKQVSSIRDKCGENEYLAAAMTHLTRIGIDKADVAAVLR